MKWFGEPWPRADWPAPVCEDPVDRVPVPVGMACVVCDEPIGEGDSGILTPVMLVDGSYIGAEHKECLVRSTAGPLAHIDRRCSCYGGTDHATPGLTARQEAVAVYERVTRVRRGEYP